MIATLTGVIFLFIGAMTLAKHQDINKVEINFTNVILIFSTIALIMFGTTFLVVGALK